MSYALIFGCVAALASLAAGQPFVAYLRGRNIGKAISTDGPESHLTKAGTPTMGGLLFTSVIVVIALAAAVPKDRAVLLPIIIMAVFAAMGFYDDLGTLIDREKREAHDRTTMIVKLIGFTAVAIVAAWFLSDRIDAPRLLIPHYGAYHMPAALYIPLAIAVIISMTSAVGVTDGIDMLAGSTSAVAFAAFGSIALTQHQTGLATFCFVTVGALVGFLWYNAYPARLFMGDTGSLPLGASLAVVALMTGWWLLLPVVGIVFVIEILSDVIQIGSYRLRGGKRVFRMAPLHIHFEKAPTHEVTVTLRFGALGVVGAMLALALVALD